MKKVYKILTCIVVSITIQFTVLYYLDTVILRESNEFSIENVEVFSNDNSEIQGEIAPNAKDIQGSYNGNYIMYFINDRLFLVNTKTGETKNILKGENILSVKWVPNNNTIFIVENRNNKINIKTFNAVNEAIQDICELCDYKDKIFVHAYISMASEYVVINDNDNTNIYRINIEKEVKIVEDKIKKIDNAAVFWNKDMFIYKDSINNEFYKYTNNNIEKINIPNNMKILKLCNNKIYLGEYSSDNTIKKIIYGSEEEEISMWNTLNIDNINCEKIYINDNGNIYVNDDLKHIVKNITNNEEIKYEGYFAFLNDTIICSVVNGKVNYKKLQ